MTPISQTNPVDYYFGFLQNLSANNKLDLIAKLSQSLKQADEKPDVSLRDLFGAYKSAQTADEIIADIRASRVSTRQREEL